MADHTEVPNAPSLRVSPLRHDVIAAGASVLADSFTVTQYPWTVWTVSSDAHRARLRDIFEIFLANIAVPYGLVDAVEVDGQICGVAVWLPSDAPIPDEVWSRVSEVQLVLAGDRADAARSADVLLDELRPDGPHVKLATVAVAPTRQGLGYGRVLMQHGLRRAEENGALVYLETSSASNVLFYESLGFVVRATRRLPESGPTVWTMHRTARGFNRDHVAGPDVRGTDRE